MNTEVLIKEVIISLSKFEENKPLKWVSSLLYIY